MIVLVQSRKEEQTPRAQRTQIWPKFVYLFAAKKHHTRPNHRKQQALLQWLALSTQQPHIAFETYEPGAFLCILLFSLWGSLHVIWFPPTVQGEEPLVNLLIILSK